jgi:hypothetical protein
LDHGRPKLASYRSIISKISYGVPDQRQLHQSSFAAIAAGAVVVGSLLLLAYFLVNEFRKADGPDQTGKLARPPAMTAEVTEFLGFVQDNSAEARMGPEHNYTSDGIRYLSAALGSLARQGKILDLNVEQRRASLMQYSARIKENRQSTDHADLARKAFISASELFADLANKRFPEQRDQAQRLRQTAQAIDPNRLLLDQKAEVREFFTRASDSLQAMSQADNGAKTSINTSRS